MKNENKTIYKSISWKFIRISYLPMILLTIIVTLAGSSFVSNSLKAEAGAVSYNTNVFVFPLKRTGWLQNADRIWYYVFPDGTMARSEYVNGYWLNKNGTWTYKKRAGWKHNKTGWWYGDSTGWYAKNQSLKIDRKIYRFDKKGYLY